MYQRFIALSLLWLLLPGCTHKATRDSKTKAVFRVIAVEADGQPQLQRKGDSLRADIPFALQVEAPEPVWIQVLVLETGTTLWLSDPKRSPISGTMRLPLEKQMWLRWGTQITGRLCILASRTKLVDAAGLCSLVLPEKSPCELPPPNDPNTSGGGRDTPGSDKDEGDKKPTTNDPAPEPKGPDGRPGNPQGLGVWELLEKGVTRVTIPVQGT